MILTKTEEGSAVKPVLPSKLTLYKLDTRVLSGQKPHLIPFCLYRACFTCLIS